MRGEEEEEEDVEAVDDDAKGQRWIAGRVKGLN